MHQRPFLYGQRDGFAWREGRICVDRGTDLRGERDGFAWREGRICVERGTDLRGERDGFVWRGAEQGRVWLSAAGCGG